MKDQARLVRRQDIDRHAPRLVMTIDYPNLQVRRAQIIFTLEDIDTTSQHSVIQHDFSPLGSMQPFHHANVTDCAST
jgi:hypothetical protein